MFDTLHIKFRFFNLKVALFALHRPLCEFRMHKDKLQLKIQAATFVTFKLQSDLRRLMISNFDSVCSDSLTDVVEKSVGGHRLASGGMCLRYSVPCVHENRISV